MQKILAFNNWGAVIQDETVLSTDTEITIGADDATELGTIGDGEFVIITVSNGSALEIMHIIGISGAVLTVERAKEGTGSLVFSEGDVMEARPTAGFAEFVMANIARVKNLYDYNNSI